MSLPSFTPSSMAQSDAVTLLIVQIVCINNPNVPESSQKILSISASGHGGWTTCVQYSIHWSGDELNGFLNDLWR